MPQLGRADLFAMLRGLLTPDTFLYATFDATPVPRISPNPLTWNMRTETLSTEAWRWGLGTTSGRAATNDTVRPASECQCACLALTTCSSAASRPGFL